MTSSKTSEFWTSLPSGFGCNLDWITNIQYHNYATSHTSSSFGPTRQLFCPLSADIIHGWSLNTIIYFYTPESIFALWLRNFPIQEIHYLSHKPRSHVIENSVGTSVAMWGPPYYSTAGCWIDWLLQFDSILLIEDFDPAPSKLSYPSQSAWQTHLQFSFRPLN